MNIKVKEKIGELLLSLKGNPQRRARVITAVGILGIIMIMLSECGAGGEKEKSGDKTAGYAGGGARNTDFRNADVLMSARELEEKLEAMIERIDGAGDASVMITFEDDGETRYVSEEKLSDETLSEKSSTGEIEKIREKSEREEKYITVDSKSDGKEALVSQNVAPRIRGVIVVCDGGDSPEVAEKLTRTVKTALNIGSNRIYVLK